MIKINLLGDETAIDRTGMMVLMGFAASLVLCLAVCGYMYTSVQGELTELSSKELDLKDELAHLEEVNKEVREFEKKKNNLNTKLMVIGRLKKNKTGPVRVLDDLNMALPDRAWLTSLQEKAGSLKIQGVALDPQTAAEFYNELRGSDYFVVENVETSQDQYKGITVHEFTLSTKVNYAGRLGKAQDAHSSGAGKG